MILSRDEVLRILGAATNPWHRVLLMAIYAGGLRLGEVRSLRVGDVDEARMTIRVRSGKGGKDRYVPLSKTLLASLRPRLAGQPPDAWLFPGATAGRPLNATTIQRVFKRAAQGADIRKRVSIHSLRHAFATHMLEDGAHIRAVQQVLGHQSLSTTTIYIHCTPSYVRRLRSPLDRIAREAGDGRGAGG